MIQRNLEERVYFVVKLSGNSPSLIGSQDRDLEAGIGTETTGIWLTGFLSLLSNTTQGHLPRGNPASSGPGLYQSAMKKMSHTLPTGNLMEPFSPLRVPFPDNCILYQVDKNQGGLFWCSCFWTGSHFVALVWNWYFFCRPGWLWACGNSPASASQVQLFCFKA